MADGQSTSKVSPTTYDSIESEPLLPLPKQERKQKQVLLKLILVVQVLIFAALVPLYYYSFSRTGKHPVGSAAPTNSVFPDFDIKQHWGSFSPYFDSGDVYPGVDSAERFAENGLPDEQCRFKQVHVLHRHAERYPTPDSHRPMRKTADKLKRLDSKQAVSHPLLTNWDFGLSTALLVPTGTGTEFSSGALFWATHGRLLFNASEKGYLFYDPSLNLYENGTSAADSLPVLRATSQSRIRTSARNWAAGFFGLFGEDPLVSDEKRDAKPKTKLYELVEQIEGRGINNTLAGYYSCKNAGNSSYTSGVERVEKWVDIYLVKAAERLQKYFFPHLKVESTDLEHVLTPFDAFAIQKLCVHETAAYGNLSPFCTLFTREEWEGYEYSEALSFFGFASYGTVLGASEGAGWIHELLARLEHRTITEPAYGVNVTLTGSEETFPLDQPLYVDLSHDSVIISVITALGLDFLKEDLKSTIIPRERNFRISRLTPFGARLYVELYECTPGDVLVRLKLNNRILPLKGLEHCDGTVCALNDFTKSLAVALKNIDYDEICFGTPENVDWE
ncbi:hypothetical protein DV495_000867 [Geotrichum candidum]|nr:hypothetical protein DV454_003860 [Geotrichum candidum]KAF5122775.1 hypothetical protein DV452_000539 [Geotrichum candidum]KAF5135366.1 hypothetical protein DV495_000867 [Geotrichum candidum]KAI8133964.1 hypothetical protein DUD61_002396 [Geotrichum candidum]KAI9213620.1 hypothetical protein DS838_001493 [Geotrichum bryndzae]